MKVGIVALNYKPGTIGGAETYYLDLIKYLQVIDTNNQYIIYMRNDYGDHVKITSPNFKVRVLSRGIFSKILNRITRKFLGFDAESRVINNDGLDLLHFPFQVIGLPRLKVKAVLTVHDIQEQYHPEFFGKEELQSRIKVFPSSVSAAAHIVAVSYFTRDSLIEKYNTNPKKISVVYEAYDEDLYNKKKVATKLDLPKKYFYYPAATWPHKNHELLLQAFSRFVISHPKYHLVLSGIKKQQTAEVDDLIAELGLQKKVIRLGYIKTEDLPAVYQNAQAMVFPSLFEGFGLPVLEAMASGCPVLCSNTTSLPEVGGKAAGYFDPKSQDSITRALEDFVADSKQAAIMQKEGFNQAAKFSAKKMAQETLEIYQKIGDQL